jgi:hypothetical protein
MNRRTFLKLAGLTITALAFPSRGLSQDSVVSTVYLPSVWQNYVTDVEVIGEEVIEGFDTGLFTFPITL